MKFEEQLKEWNRYFKRTRQVGHTYSAMNGVLNNKKAVLVCANEIQRNLFPKGKTINFYSNLKGINLPVVFDNFTIHMLIIRSLYERIDKQKVKEVIERCIIETKEDKVINLFKHKDEGAVLSVDLLNLKKELGLDE